MAQRIIESHVTRSCHACGADAYQVLQMDFMNYSLCPSCMAQCQNAQQFFLQKAYLELNMSKYMEIIAPFID
jgi:hypothetical protein